MTTAQLHKTPSARSIARLMTLRRDHLTKPETVMVADAGPSLLASFVHGIQKDLTAIRAAVTETWSNGHTEGQVNKLKLTKRPMYGRAKIDLLEARLLGAA